MAPSTDTKESLNCLLKKKIFFKLFASQLECKISEIVKTLIM